MTDRRLLAFDLDQTIVTTDHELPVQIRDSIFRAREAGHHVVVLTGRPLATAEPILEQLEVTDHYSVNHGALVFGTQAEILRRVRLEWTDVLQILSPDLLVEQLEFSCVIDDTLYVREPSDTRWKWAHTNNRRVAEFHHELNLKADKVVFSTDSDPFTPHSRPLLELAEKLEQEILARHPHYVTYLWNNGYLEVTSPGSDKGSALELLAQELGVERENTVAFGDGLNDLKMLEWAGHSVAVGPHAHPRTLAAADEHIAPPEEGGVRDWLERNLGV
ncbi:MAG TPA: HAD family hydrolase [Deinococcales bacterium]|nr:HAD family hydrolase [Deinococcales bacterium]